MNNKIILIFLTCLVFVGYAQAQTSKAFFDSVIKMKIIRKRLRLLCLM